MMDEQRRFLEIEARYSERLNALLICMRDGHTDGGPVIAARDVPMMVEEKAVMVRVEAIGCKRCNLVHWIKR